MQSHSVSAMPNSYGCARRCRKPSLRANVLAPSGGARTDARKLPGLRSCPLLHGLTRSALRPRSYQGSLAVAVGHQRNLESCGAVRGQSFRSSCIAQHLLLVEKSVPRRIDNSRIRRWIMGNVDDNHRSCDVRNDAFLDAVSGIDGVFLVAGAAGAGLDQS
jgi:hypothetical protein